MYFKNKNIFLLYMLRRLTRKKSRKRQSSSSTGSFMNQVPISMRNNDFSTISFLY